MWFCGLRGAMAYALALDAADTFKEDGEIMLTMTVVINAFNVNYELNLNYLLDFCVRFNFVICLGQMRYLREINRCESKRELI